MDTEYMPKTVLYENISASFEARQGRDLSDKFPYRTV